MGSYIPSNEIMCSELTKAAAVHGVGFVKLPSDAELASLWSSRKSTLRYRGQSYSASAVAASIVRDPRVKWMVPLVHRVDAAEMGDAAELLLELRRRVEGT